MKKSILNYFLAAFVSVGMSSCQDDDSNGGGPNPVDVPLVEHNNKTFGWGQGRLNTDAYLSLSVGDGQIQSFRTVGDDDEATQMMVDLVFPGDWGPADGSGVLSIVAPNASGPGGAHWEYCKYWDRKNGTQIGDLDDFDLTDFENVNSAAQLMAIHQEYVSVHQYRNFVIEPSEGRSFIVKTESGRLGIIYIKDVTGTYGSETAKVTLHIKMMPDLD